MSLTTSEMTPADVAAVTGNNRNDGTFGGNGAWWIIILFLFIFCGWSNGGRGGNEGGNGNNSGAVDGYVLASDFAQMERKMDTINSGLCDGFYATAQQINGVQNTLCQGFSGVTAGINSAANSIQQSLQADTMANLQNTNALSRQLADCCCENRAAIAQVRYDMATQACDTRSTIQSSARDIIDNANANSRAILDFLTQDKIATLTAENQSLKFQASQTAQNAFISANQEAQTAELIRRLGRDCPVPAYVVPNPNCCYGTPVGVYPNSTGCGCAV